MSGFIHELREYAGPFYYGASTNALGGIVFGILSNYFNPRIPMPEAPPYIFLRVLFGLGAGVAYSLGAFGLTLSYINRFANLINKNFKNGTARDSIYSFLSIGASLFILVVSAYFLFLVYGGRVPVKMNEESTYLSFSSFISSISRTNWTEVVLIPIYGILIKGSLRTVKRFFSLKPEKAETMEQA